MLFRLPQGLSRLNDANIVVWQGAHIYFSSSFNHITYDFFFHFSYVLHFDQAFMGTKLPIFFRASQLIEPCISRQQTIRYPMATNVVSTIPLIRPPALLFSPDVSVSFLMSSNVAPYQPPPFQIVSFFNNNDATPFYPCKNWHSSPNLA